MFVAYVKRLKSSYSSSWVNASYVTYFNSTASSGSDQIITLGNIRDGGDLPFLGTIAAMVEWAIIIVVYASSGMMKRQCEYTV